MPFVDFILSIACLLLWLNWRSHRFDPLARSTPATLVGTLKPLRRPIMRGTAFLAALGALLVGRALIYWAIGLPADWTPKLNLGVVVLAFRSHWFAAALLFSLLSFLRIALVFYFWVLVLVILDRKTLDPDPIQKVLRLHMGRIGRWPGILQLLTAFILLLIAWSALHPLLVYTEVLDRARSFSQVLQQGLLVIAALVTTLKYVLPLILFLHLVASYIYFGTSPVWSFIAGTAKNLLAPLCWLPLRAGRLDFAPVVGVVLVLVVFEVLPSLLMSHLARRGLTLWPH